MPFRHIGDGQLTGSTGKGTAAKFANTRNSTVFYIIGWSDVAVTFLGLARFFRRDARKFRARILPDAHTVDFWTAGAPKPGTALHWKNQLRPLPASCVCL